MFFGWVLRNFAHLLFLQFFWYLSGCILSAIALYIEYTHCVENYKIQNYNPIVPFFLPTLHNPRPWTKFVKVSYHMSVTILRFTDTRFIFVDNDFGVKYQLAKNSSGKGFNCQNFMKIFWNFHEIFASWILCQMNSLPVDM